MTGKKKPGEHFPFLILCLLLSIGSLGIGIYHMVTAPDSALSYLQSHAERPFWTDLLGDRIPGAFPEMVADAAQETAEGRNDPADAGDRLQPVADAQTSAAGLSEDGGETPSGSSETGDLSAPGSEQAQDSAGAGAREDEENGAEGMQEAPGDAQDPTEEPAAEGYGPNGRDPYFTEDGLQLSGMIRYQTYEPALTDSPYYTDRGLIAESSEYAYETVEDDYFADAAFIGDSRMLGLHDYSGWMENADFYCENGFSVFRWSKGDPVTLQSHEGKNAGTKVDLETAMREKHYGKIYLLAGMNDLGYGNTVLFQGWLRDLTDMLRETQPDAVLYLLSNLHISKEQDGVQPAMDNLNTNDKNVAISGLADGENVFYLDANPLFCDADGYLLPDITFDGYHLYAADYSRWADFLKEHAVVR